MGSTSGLASEQGKQPLFSFGVISDVQYADIPDGYSFIGVPRYYQHSIQVLQRAVQKWNNHGMLKFVINFGDIVDGKCPRDESLNAVKKVTNEFGKFNGPIYHMIVPLDGLNNPKTLEALEFLRSKNPNSEKNSPEGLLGLQRRFLMFNGAVGKNRWNDPGVSSPEALLWNYDEVMNVIHRYNCVKVCLSGHDHKGGYSIDSHGIHHKSFEAALECPPGTDSFGYIEVYDNRLMLFGTDRMESTDMSFSP
ncbi:hypothetical protein GH714_040627 [Hevea brasiliensis]|uniref:Calcineurin-like phosphoesterase domain-containing protein n=1 Tax=Hevea brasiliensis TaxID=3981 RepID=A0A6A6KZ49_HEVBR|nr:hypothetical protein GH714_040627 [Hevea brasiliensis]